MTANPIVQRKSLPLTERDLADIATLRGSAPHRAALSTLVGGLPDSTSESQLLHALLAAGLRAVEDRVMEEGYEALARDPEIQEYHAARRAHRRRPASADEE